MLRTFMGYVVLLLLSAGPLAGAAWQEPEEEKRGRGGARLEEVLAEVLENQTKTLEDRRNWIFRQQTLVRFFRGNGELAREELRQYEVRPKPDGMEREMQSLAGKVVIGKKTYPYADPEYRSGTIDLDGELADSFADEFLFEEKSRDGVPADLFPVSREMVERHAFTLHGLEDYKGRPVYRITFVPLKKTGEKPGGWWKGEMLVDAVSKQPVLIVTTQAKGLPVAVRTLLGVNLRQTGFRLEYVELEPGVWFPARYGGEFSLRVLFGYSRRIALSLRNEEFRRAKAESEIRYEGEAEAPGGETPEAARSPLSETPAAPETPTVPEALPVPEAPAMPEMPMPQ
jgi:hypothetical protein